ncbi:SAM-dependent methyltransferase [Psychrobacter sp. DAB_AL62B]|uniref:SAM-dependent methyltransferase n=1 Tax=Psychrobacter sp. DAB_AL62B TaxID=1028420 RepID=UPI0023810916|nr:tRNA (N6-threonylcarbamoyladenosine(37)-N6)-methyltransferase TrmO [Psychrobacter sp. DAB_AL62B]MDE4453656.1 SAM-dependent methyltransferase [Psychrobacter sp. DAB_AL62B]
MNCQTDSLMSHHTSPIIGYHHAPLSQKFGAPRQPNLVALTSVIEMIAPYNTPAAFIGLADFSHIWISWQFHHNYLNKEKQIKKDEPPNNDSQLNKANSSFRAQVRPPRLGGNQKIGVFASRSMYRPSALGLSVVKLEAIEIVEGRVLLIISGADMIDGTPIIDIKPYVAYSDAVPDAKSGFAPSAPALLTVTITEPAYEQFLQFIADQSANNEEQNNNEEKKDSKKDTRTVTAVIDKAKKQLLLSDFDVIKALIAQDPRPAYRRKEINTPFVMRYKSVDVSFQLIALGELQITAVIEV